MVIEIYICENPECGHIEIEHPEKCPECGSPIVCVDFVPASLLDRLGTLVGNNLDTISDFIKAVADGNEIGVAQAAQRVKQATTHLAQTFTEIKHEIHS